jgi:hypothetical protein
MEAMKIVGRTEPFLGEASDLRCAGLLALRRRLVDEKETAFGHYYSLNLVVWCLTQVAVDKKLVRNVGMYVMQRLAHNTTDCHLASIQPRAGPVLLEALQPRCVPREPYLAQVPRGSRVHPGVALVLPLCSRLLPTVAGACSCLSPLLAAGWLASGGTPPSVSYPVCYHRREAKGANALGTWVQSFTSER